MTKITIDPNTKQWTAASVRKALAHAFKVLNATTGPVGHKRLKAAMPEYQYSAADIAEQQHMELAARRRGETTMAKRKQAMIKPNSREISRSDLILFGRGDQKPWLKLINAYPDHKRELIAAVLGAARGHSARTVARRMGVAESTFRLHINFAAATIAKQLNRAGVERW